MQSGLLLMWGLRRRREEGVGNHRRPVVANTHIHTRTHKCTLTDQLCQASARCGGATCATCGARRTKGVAHTHGLGPYTHVTVAQSRTAIVLHLSRKKAKPANVVSQCAPWPVRLAAVCCRLCHPEPAVRAACQRWEAAWYPCRHTEHENTRTYAHTRLCASVLARVCTRKAG